MSDGTNSESEFAKELDKRVRERADKRSDVLRLQQEVAFERALARFNHEKWALKGGCAVRYFSENSRLTVDIDMVLKEGDLLKLAPDARTRAIKERVESELSKDTRDHFVFEVTNAIRIEDLGPKELAAMVICHAKVDGKEYCTVRIDVGIQEQEILPPERVPGHDLLDFANVPNPVIQTIAREEVFAGKVLAYDQQGTTGLRTKDLVDMELLLNTGIDRQNLQFALEAVFARAERKLPKKMAAPPEKWEKDFDEIAKEAGVQPNIGLCYERVASVVDAVLARCQPF